MREGWEGCAAWELCNGCGEVSEVAQCSWKGKREDSGLVKGFVGGDLFSQPQGAQHSKKHSKSYSRGQGAGPCLSPLLSPEVSLGCMQP